MRVVPDHEGTPERPGAAMLHDSPAARGVDPKKEILRPLLPVGPPRGRRQGPRCDEGAELGVRIAAETSALWGGSEPGGCSGLSRSAVDGSARPSRPSVSQVATLVLVLLYPCFFSVLPRGIGQAAFVLGCSLVCLSAFGSWRWTTAPPGALSLIWIMLAVYASASAAAGYGSFAYAVPLFSLAVLTALASGDRRGWVAWAFRVLVAMCLIHAAATILFYAVPGLYESLISPRFFTDSVRPLDYRSGLTSNRAYNATYCAVGFLITSAVALTRARSGVLRAAALPAVFLFALLLADKRAHLLYSVLALVLMALAFNSRRVRVRSLVAGLAGVVIIAGVASVSTGVADSLARLTGTLDAADPEAALSGRPLLWRAALAGWAEHPVFGWGWGSFTFTWPGSTTVSVIAHNQLLNSAYEGGIVGLVLVVAATVGSWAFVLHRTREAVRGDGAHHERAPLLAICLALQTYFLLYSFTGGELLSKPYSFVIYLLSVGAAFSLSPPRAGTEAVPGAVERTATRAGAAALKSDRGVAE